jgi:hypothetical protein
MLLQSFDLERPPPFTRAAQADGAQGHRSTPAGCNPAVARFPSANIHSERDPNGSRETCSSPHLFTPSQFESLIAAATQSPRLVRFETRDDVVFNSGRSLRKEPCVSLERYWVQVKMTISHTNLERSGRPQYRSIFFSAFAISRFLSAATITTSSKSAGLPVFTRGTTVLAIATEWRDLLSA